MQGTTQRLRSSPLAHGICSGISQVKRLVGCSAKRHRLRSQRTYSTRFNKWTLPLGRLVKN